MDHSISDELYSESLKLLNGELGPNFQAYHNQSGTYEKEVDDDDDGFLWDELEEQNSKSDLDREWQRRRDQFHTIGYRDGLTAGKEASAQEGFNGGFKESVLVGYNWGLVRGVTSALSCLPNGLREKLMDSQEDFIQFQSLYESVHSLSTTDALKSFHDSLMAKRAAEQNEKSETSAITACPKDEDSDILQNYSKEVKSLILKTPTIKVNFLGDE